MASKRIVVIGGSAAGPKTACKAKRTDPNAEVTLVQRSPDLSMASCAFPYYIRDGFDRRYLVGSPGGAIRDAAFFRTAKDVRAWVLTEAIAIDRVGRRVEIQRLEGGEKAWLEYDKLVLATGAVPFLPPVAGLDLAGVHTLWSLQDTDRIKQRVEQDPPQRAVVVGGGLVGLEMAEALKHLGAAVTVIEKAPHILPFLDPEMASLVESHLRSKGVPVLTRSGLAEFRGQDGRLASVRLDSGQELECDFALLAIGVRPNAQLARAAGLQIGSHGGIRVDGYLQTSDPDIYAAGDCIEVTHRVTGEYRHIPLGDLANLQGRVAGQNVVLGNTVRYPGVLGTGACKIFDFNVGSTGVWEQALVRSGRLDCITAICAQSDSPGYMGGQPLTVKLVAERASGRLLGMQAVGLGDVTKRVAVAATALHGNLNVEDLTNLDLPYAPPYSTAIDPIITAAHVLDNKLRGRMHGTNCLEVQERLDRGERLFLLDVRNPEEYEATRLECGEKLIPLARLRSSNAELPSDRSAEIIVYCRSSLRGYEAAVLLKSMNYTNVKVMEGGLLAWAGPLVTGHG
ncbi:FAD-dependent oxidoreductase [Myxococcota bacterium]